MPSARVLLLPVVALLLCLLASGSAMDDFDDILRVTVDSAGTSSATVLLVIAGLLVALRLI